MIIAELKIVSKPICIRLTEIRCIPPGQRQATYIFDDADEAPGDWLGGSVATDV